jgi:hypothetical protein
MLLCTMFPSRIGARANYVMMQFSLHLALLMLLTIIFDDLLLRSKLALVPIYNSSKPILGSLMTHSPIFTSPILW